MKLEHAKQRTNDVLLMSTLLAVVVCVIAATILTIADFDSTWAGIVRTFGCHLPIFLGAWRLSGRGMTQPVADSSSCHRLLIAVYIYFSTLIALGLFLGQFHGLSPLLGLSLSTAAGALMIWIGRHNTIPMNPPRPTNTPVRLLKTVLVLFILLMAAHSFWQPNYAYDVLTYHLMFPARWVQDHAISIIPTWCGDPAPSYSPLATEVYYLWLMLPIRGDTLARCGQFPFWLLLLLSTGALTREMKLTPAARIATVLLLGLIPTLLSQAPTAMVDIAFAAHLVSIIYFSLRLIRKPNRFDAAGAALAAGLLAGTKYASLVFLAAIAPLLLWAIWRSLRSKRIAMYQPALLLACGLAVWNGGFWYARNLLLTGNPVYPLTVQLGSTVLFDGAYGRAQMENSPFNVRRIDSDTAFGETIRRIFQTQYSPLESGQTFGTARPSAATKLWHGRLARDSTGETPAPQTSLQDAKIPKVSRTNRPAAWPLPGPFACLAGLFVIGWIVMICRGTSDRRRWCLYYLCSALSFAAFWWVLPFQQPRFAWGPMALALVGAAASVRLHRHVGMVLFVFVGLLSWQFFGEEIAATVSLPAGVWIAIIIVAALASLLRRSKRLMAAAPLIVTAITPALFIFAACTAPDARVRAFSMPRWRFLGGTWSWIDRHVHGATIAYVGNNVPYFLAGRRLENRIYYVPARLPAQGRFDEYAVTPEAVKLGPPNTSEPAVDRYVMDPNLWLNNLRTLGVEYVFVTQLLPNLLVTIRHDPSGFPIERQWLDALCRKTERFINDPGSTGSRSDDIVQVERMDFAGGRSSLYHLKWGQNGNPSIDFPTIHRDETDALDRLPQDHTRPGRPIRDYPLARSIITYNHLSPITP